MPIAFSTAIYGLCDLGRLEKGDTVLIQSATGAAGLAACQIARMVGAEIFATVGTGDKKRELLGAGFGIKDSHAQRILEQTDGRGVDVILCSARGELMHEYWKIIAPCGGFVETGRTEVLVNGILSLDVFRRNATSTSFDLEVLSRDKPQVTARLMSTIQELKEEGFVKPLPLQKYSIADIDKAFMTFTKGTHVGKLLIEYGEQPTDEINVQRDPFTTHFDPQAAYLLVGCLGGTDLEEQGVDAKVVIGDVTSLRDVESVVDSSPLPIKGVVQGVLAFNNGLFESMSLDRFNATVLPRVIGTLNLYQATLNSPLEFFELWSSWTVIFGTATQSNYLASNSFLDAFARHRRAKGLPCTSLALSQILGIRIVSYMPEYQQTMIRNGFYGNDEDEFLSYCEQALLPTPSAGVTYGDSTFKYDPLTHGHLLVGIEPAGLKNIDSKYPLSDMPWSQDPRFRNLIQATAVLSSLSQGRRGAAVEEGTVQDKIISKISRLLYIPTDEVDAEKPITDYGIDSIVAAELRNWTLAAFGKEVSMLKLLGPGMTVQKLAEEVEVKPAEGAKIRWSLQVLLLFQPDDS